MCNLPIRAAPGPATVWASAWPGRPRRQLRLAAFCKPCVCRCRYTDIPVLDECIVWLSIAPESFEAALLDRDGNAPSSALQVAIRGAGLGGATA